MIEDWEHGGFAVYVHWPFCLAKCPYCDFNSHVRREVDHDRWRAALVREFETAAAELGDRKVTSVFFGGGTPSLMPPETVEAVISAIGTRFELAPSTEISLEANPTSVEIGKFRGFVDAGVNRFSLGVQSLRDTHLKALGRMHSASEALKAIEVAKSVCDRVSIDLIYARQNQSFADWEVELADALATGVDHLSLYQLTIEEGTRFWELASRDKLRGLPDQDLAADMYLRTQEICEEAGFLAYEVSNHARGDAACRHNMTYWQYGDYIGIGPGAHGRVSVEGKRMATSTLSNPEKWLAQVESTGTGYSSNDVLTRDEQADEYLLMSLRTVSGTDLNRLQAIGSRGPSFELVQRFKEDGFLELNDNIISVTQSGRLFLNKITSELAYTT